MRPQLGRLVRWFLCIAVFSLGCTEGGAVGPLDVSDASVDWNSNEIVVTGTCTHDDDCLPASDCVLSSSCELGRCVYLFATPGSDCAEGCYSQGKCLEGGVCSGTQLRDCPETDGNNCTQPVCDVKSGECTEEAIQDGLAPYATSECWTGLVCLNGEADNSAAQPTATALECEAMVSELDPMGCIEGYVCVGGAEKCRPLHKEDGQMCWKAAGVETDDICRGASCKAGECVLDPTLDVSCSDDDLPQTCGAGCLACTSLTCHWIDDPANPENPTKKVRYCQPAAQLGQACAGDPCRESQGCVVGSQSSGPLGKETLGACTGGIELDAQQCAANLSKNPLPCVLAGIGCSAEKGGCTYDGALANSWCWPPEGQCYNKETTFCSHVASGANWDPTTGCSVDWVQLDCDDKNECTVDSCKAVDEGWTCLHQPLDGVACDDGDLCTNGGMCVVGECKGEVPVCKDDDNNPCNDQQCDPATGLCLEPATNDVPCDDGNACTQDDTCQETQCTPGTPVVCDDGNACNGLETCEPTTGCLPGIPLECDDGSVCNGSEWCDPASGCKPGDDLICDDNDVCNGLETCDPIAGCQDGTPLVCGNSDVCDGIETCDAELGCLPGAELVCLDQDLCDGTESCDAELGCQEGTPLVCLNTNLCDGTETCDAELGCVPGTPLNCSDQNVCTGTETCSPLVGCLDGTPLVCSNGNVCDGIETCNPISGCQAGTPLSCSDQNVCNGTETCSPTLGCQDGTPLTCGNSNVCDGIESCDAELGCLPGTALTCLDQNLCDGTETCDAALGCQEGTPLVCLNTNLCDGTETCDAELGCVPGTALNCSDQNVCTGTETCSPLVGCQDGTPLVCGNSNVCDGIESCNPISGCQAGTPLSCSDQNVCNGTETCSPTLGCQDGTPLTCGNSNVCDGIETCHPTSGCQAGTSLACDDQDVCNGTETCSPSLGCQAGEPLVCTNGNACDGVETCDADLGCLPGTPLDCTDQNLCNGTETCNPPTGCQAGTTLDCNDNLACTTDTCNALLGCQHSTAPDGTTCPGGTAYKCVSGTCQCVPQCVGIECGDDQCGGSCGSCTSPEECVLGTCQGGSVVPTGNFTISPPIVYTCLSGGININITEVMISESGGTATATFLPTMCAPLTGTWNSSTNVLAVGSDVCWVGSCQHTYIFVATFSDSNNFTAQFIFTPQQMGLNLCPGCTKQIKNGVVGTRKL